MVSGRVTTSSVVPFWAKTVEKGSVPDHAAARILAGDPTVFATPDDPAFASVSTRLGWVTAPHTMLSHVDALNAFASRARGAGLRLM